MPRHDNFSCTFSITSLWRGLADPCHTYPPKKFDPPERRETSVRSVGEVRKTLPKQTLAEVLHVFLTSLSNEILQNHHFLAILKIAMDPKHSQTHGPEAPAPYFSSVFPGILWL